MHNLSNTIANVNVAALDAALKAALPGKVQGVSASAGRDGSTLVGPDEPNAKDGIFTPHNAPLVIHMDDSAPPADDAAALAIVAAHDPVFLEANKTVIAADGIDTVSIKVVAPRGLAGVTLQVSANGGPLVDWPSPIALVAGVGTDTLTAQDPGTFVVTVKNPTNRSNAGLTIIAR